jgi:hypothetical protein
MFGATTRYGKVIYQHVEVVYQGRGDARTQWRVQFEDGEEFDLKYDEILHGFNLLMREPIFRAIHIPNDRGDLGRPGAVNGPAQRAIGRLQHDEFTKVETNEVDDGEYLDKEDDEGSEVPVEEGMHFVGAGDDFDEFDIFADFVDPSLIDYLASHVSEGHTVNMLSRIVRTICDRRGSLSNESVIFCFERERDTFCQKIFLDVGVLC